MLDPISIYDAIYYLLFQLFWIVWLTIYAIFKGVMALLRPLLLDNVPSIQQSAALALGRLANYSDELAEAVVSNEILPQLVYSLSEQNVSNCLFHLFLTYFKFLMTPYISINKTSIIAFKCRDYQLCDITRMLFFI